MPKTYNNLTGLFNGDKWLCALLHCPHLPHCQQSVCDSCQLKWGFLGNGHCQEKHPNTAWSLPGHTQIAASRGWVSVWEEVVFELAFRVQFRGQSLQSFPPTCPWSMERSILRWWCTDTATLTFNPLFSLSTISEWLSMSDQETVLGVEQLLWHRDKCNGHPGRKIYVVSVTLGYHWHIGNHYCTWMTGVSECGTDASTSSCYKGLLPPEMMWHGVFVQVCLGLTYPSGIRCTVLRAHDTF